ncbi:MAG: response regulator [Candidatus Omnitrophica bacterium]|nr:response regulator [Candidatus Omnitrophota bacterium]
MLKHKILIIDAHPVYVNKTEGFLRGLTFHNITIARNGKEGQEKAKSIRPDLIILSAMLPDMDSFDVCEAVKKNSPESRIIVQVGLFYAAEEIERFMSLGADRVLDRKEKDLQPLQNAIEDLMVSS